MLTSVIDVAAYASSGSGTQVDPWTGWDVAITWTGNRAYYFRPGYFLLTTTLALPNNYTHLFGAGIRTAIIDFEPTANDTALYFANGASSVWRCSVQGLTLRSDDATWTKVGIDLVDVRGFVLRDVEINGSVTVGTTDMWSGANSIGLRTQGREALTTQNVFIAADRPIVMAENPNVDIDTDHFHLTDMDLTANANPVVEIADDMYATNLTFSGRQAWVKGTYGLYWVDTTGTLAAQNIRLENVR